MGTIDRQPGSGRPRSVRVPENTEEELVLSQEDNPKTHRSIREISSETVIHRSTVHKMIVMSSSSVSKNLRVVNNTHVDSCNRYVKWEME